MPVAAVTSSKLPPPALRKSGKLSPFSAGGAWRPPTEFIARASDSFLFEHMRCGDLTYRIPLKPGVYELHLFFLTLARADASNSFNISLNGKLALQSFDINSDALGENIADERIIRDVSPRADGFLEIALYGVTGQPTLSALEILPGLPHAQLPIRLIMQSTPFTDRSGQFWVPDNYFMKAVWGLKLVRLSILRILTSFPGKVQTLHVCDSGGYARSIHADPAFCRALLWPKRAGARRRG